MGRRGCRGLALPVGLGQGRRLWDSWEDVPLRSLMKRQTYICSPGLGSLRRGPGGCPGCPHANLHSRKLGGGVQLLLEHWSSFPELPLSLVGRVPPRGWSWERGRQGWTRGWGGDTGRGHGRGRWVWTQGLAAGRGREHTLQLPHKETGSAAPRTWPQVWKVLRAALPSTTAGDAFGR